MFIITVVSKDKNSGDCHVRVRMVEGFNITYTDNAYHR